MNPASSCTSLIEKTRLFIRNPDNRDLSEVLKAIKSVITVSFVKAVSDEDINNFIEGLETATYCLLKLSDKVRIEEDEIRCLVRNIFDSMFYFKESTISSNFERIIHVLIFKSLKWSRTKRNDLIWDMINVLKYCSRHLSAPSCSFQDLDEILSKKTLSKIEEDENLSFSNCIIANVISAIFMDKSSTCTLEADAYEELFKVCQTLLETRCSPSNDWMTKVVISSMTHILNIFRCTKSPIGRLKSLNSLLESVSNFKKSSNPPFSVIESAIVPYIEEIEKYFEDNIDMMIFHKEMRDLTLQCLFSYLQICSDYNDKDFGLLGSFSYWINSVSANFESPPDMMKKTCIESIDLSVARIRRIVGMITSSRVSLEIISQLPKYLDIVASLSHISGISRNDLFEWIEKEFHELSSMENPKWINILQALLSVENSLCQKHFKELAPTCDHLWTLIKRGESRKTVNKLAILIGSCLFLDNDEGGKHIIPILLLNCLSDFLKMFGSKWENLRLHVSSKSVMNSTCTVNELDEYSQISDPKNDEFWKLRAVSCALMIDRKPHHLVQLVSDMAICTIAQSIKIVPMLPSLIHFVRDNYLSGTHIANALLKHICENKALYDDKDMRKLFSTISTILCIVSNRGLPCSKCEIVNSSNTNGDVPLKINERYIEILLKRCSEIKENHSGDTVKEFMKLCRSIIRHCECKNLSILFIPFLKCIDLNFLQNIEIFGEVWELIESQRRMNDTKAIQFYVSVFTKILAQKETIKKWETIYQLIDVVCSRKIPNETRVSLLSSCFADQCFGENADCKIMNAKITKMIMSLFENMTVSSDSDLFHLTLKKYSSVFCRAFVSRLFLEEIKDETEIREVIRRFIANLKLWFRIDTIERTLNNVRPSLLFYFLIAGTRGQTAAHVCMALDFLAQELVPSISVETVFTDLNSLKRQRKLMIKEMFPTLIQNWKFEFSKANEQMWKFCDEYCAFSQDDMVVTINEKRKDVFHRLLLISAESFENAENSSPIFDIFKKIFEGLHKGKHFSIASAMDFRNEGVEVLILFRYCFISEDFHHFRYNAAQSFQLILQMISKQFFDENWWTIYLVLRYMPRQLNDTQKCWLTFIERIEYSVLRINIWSIVANVSRFVNSNEAILRIWKRMNYLNGNEDLDINAIGRQYFWIQPSSFGNNQATKGQTRQIDDIMNILKSIDKYPSKLIIEHISHDIERGIIWKSDVPKLVGVLIGSLWNSENDEQREEISRILGKLPIFNSDCVDSEFTRWETASMFGEPLQQSPEFLDQCIGLVERVDKPMYMEYVDRTLCDIYKYMDPSSSQDIERKIMIEGIKTMYARTNCYRKPEPCVIDELLRMEGPFQLKVGSFNRWLSIMIIMCIKEGDTTLSVFISLAHTDCTQFLIVMLSRILLILILQKKDELIQKVFKEFEFVLNTAFSHRITSLQRLPACFVFYFFDFLYYFINSEKMKKNKEGLGSLKEFWTSILEMSTKDEHGTPLLVKVAEKFGMEKRCILWMEMMMEMKQRGNITSGKQTEASYYFVLMNLYAGIHDLNGVRGAYTRLAKLQIDHTLGKIRLREAFGNVAEASVFSNIGEEWKRFDIKKIVHEMYEELADTSFAGSILQREEFEDYEKSIKSLKEWVNVNTDFGESPVVFSRSISMRAFESKIIQMVTENSQRKEDINGIIFNAKKKVLENMEEQSLGGRCSYETAVPFIVQIQQLDEMRQISNATTDEIVDCNSQFWNDLITRTDESEQRLNIIEPILRVRRAMLSHVMKQSGDREKIGKIKSQIVESYLHCARVARLQGCKERAQTYIINAKKVQPFDNKIVLEEAKLQIQTCDEDGGMNLLNNILTNTFGELSKHFGDTQQTLNLDLKTSAKLKIENFPQEEKNLYSSVQMLRISHMIKAGNTIMFDQIYDETTNLLSAFVSSGVMYEAAWLLDYLFHFIERNSLTVLPLLKAYREVAKYEKNTVLQARAIERMTSLWLSNTGKLKMKIDEGKSDYAKEMITQMQVMNSEIKDALKDIGWKAFYPAYAMLARHIDHKDREVFMTIKQMMIHLIIQLPHQCMWQSVYLLRLLDCDKIERYKEVLSHVKRKHPFYTTIIEQYDYASAAFVAISKKVQDRNCMLSKAVPQMVGAIRNKKYDPKMLGFDRRNGPEKEMISGIMVPIRSDIDASVQAAKECAPSDYAATCKLDDRYILHDFNEKVKILASNTKPVLIELTILTGRKIRVICKKDDDLSKDYHFSKIVEMCNDLLTKDERTRICNMQATTYSVIPLANTGGIIEFMEDVSPYFEVLDKFMSLKSEKIGQWRNQLQSMNHERKVAYFRDVCCKETPLVMAKWFRLQYPEAGKWFASRKLFAKSSAVMSIIGYIFGLGDRHTRNLMVHIPSGKCVHVDFDMIFNKADFLGIPEVVPFRLTRNMVNGMGEVALDGEFRVVCEKTLRVFRENSYEIEKYIADLPDLVTSPELGKTAEKYDMKEAKRLVSGRLRGQIVTAKVYRSNPISNPMKVAQLASSLIELATSDEKLAEMFAGWMPFV